jgi:hypothetical protein
MAVNEVVSGVGANSSRTDKNLTARVQRVVNDAKIQNAPGGSYEERSNLTNLASGSSATTTSPMTSINAPTTGMSTSIPVNNVNVFEQGSQGVPLSDGAKGGPGRNDSILQTPVDTVNPSSIFIRAMLQANPTSRQLQMMVEADNEMEA